MSILILTGLIILGALVIIPVIFWLLAAIAKLLGLALICGGLFLGCYVLFKVGAR